MKHYYFISLWLIATVVSLLCTACHSNHPQIQAAYNLIERVTPGYGNQFQLELIDSENGKDVYEIGSQNGKVLLRGNNPVALATAYNQYLNILAMHMFPGSAINSTCRKRCLSLPKRPVTSSMASIVFT